jgi:hypothetical protein
LQGDKYSALVKWKKRMITDPGKIVSLRYPHGIYLLHTSVHDPERWRERFSLKSESSPESLNYGDDKWGKLQCIKAETGK